MRNRAGTSAPAAAEVRSHAPAFFQWGSSRYAVATRFPDNQPLANPALGFTYAGVHRGEVVTLWGTGFGPARPAVQPGSPALFASAIGEPMVFVGFIRAPLIGAALSPGLVGVYQLATQVPFNASIGDNLVRATVAGFETPDNVYIHVVRE